MSDDTRRESRVHRGRRPDGTWEVWLARSPQYAIKGLGRLQSFLVAMLLRLGVRDV